MIIKTAVFLASNKTLENLPDPRFPEFAFIGRSNVGKSSLINMVTRFNGLAKTSQTPGKTRLINHFLVNDNWYLVDLPGYGYARISRKEKEAWNKTSMNYLEKRTNLMTVFTLIDSRLSPQAIDIDFINWMGSRSIPFTLIFTKSDKQSARITGLHINSFTRALSNTWEYLPDMIISSSVKGNGRDEILNNIEQASKAFTVIP